MFEEGRRGGVAVLAPVARADGQVCAALVALLFFGFAVLYSVSFVADADFSRARFWRHCAHAGAGVAVFVAALHVPMARWRQAMLAAVIGALALCVAALGFAPAQGASRWIRFFGLSVQPSELLKFAALLAFAAWGRVMAEREAAMHAGWREWGKALIPPAVFLLAAAAVLSLQKDLGTILVLFAVAFWVLILAGTPWFLVALVAAAAAALTAVLVFFEPYRWDRIVAFLDPLADPYGSGFAQLQALMAFAHGGWGGVGLGGSLQKAILPEAHNDFVVAVIAEEMGLVGFFVLCALYLFVAMRGLRIGDAAAARGEMFGFFYAVGCAGLWLAQAGINIGGGLAALPSKGLPLPLVSYGGSSLLVCALMLGVLLRLDGENKAAAAAVAGGRGDG